MACKLLVEACGIALHWEHRVLAPGPPGKSPFSPFSLLSQVKVIVYKNALHHISGSIFMLPPYTVRYFQKYFWGVMLGFPSGSEAFSGGSHCKESACKAEDPRSISGSGRSTGEGHGNPLQYSCLENPLDRGAWRGQFMGSHNQATNTFCCPGAAGNEYKEEHVLES